MDLNAELDPLLKRLAGATSVPPDEPARLEAILAAFDAAGGPRTAAARRDYCARRDYLWMGTLATAAAALIAVTLASAWTGHRAMSSGPAAAESSASTTRGEPPLAGAFVAVPGAASLPPLESGSLVRMELPVSILPLLGMTPPATGHATEVTADIIVGQDGLPRAVRLVE